MYFKINNVDFSDMVSGLKIGYEVLVSDSSGRNANGDMTINYLTTKRKVYVTFRHTTDVEMKKIFNAIAPYIEGQDQPYFTIDYRDPKTGALIHISQVYCGTPEPEYYTIQNGFVVYKPLNLNFIEL